MHSKIPKQYSNLSKICKFLKESMFLQTKILMSIAQKRQKNTYKKLLINDKK